MSLEVADLSNFGAVSVSAPDFKAAYDAIVSELDFSSNLFSSIEGWNQIFDLLETAVDNNVFSANVPIVGDQLQDAARFINDIRRRVTDNLQQAGDVTVEFVQQKLFEALGPAGLGWLLDNDGSAGLTANDVVITTDRPDNAVDLGTREVIFDIKLGLSLIHI